MRRSDVLVVGAGPTGLVLALWLRKLGVDVRIVDKSAEPGTTSRALAVQARTLELYRQLDLTDTIVARGHKVPAVSVWVRGQRAARLAFETIGAGLTPYSFLQIFPQDEHERLLIERLAALGVEVERPTELLSFTEGEDGITAQLRAADGQTEACQATYLAGCDGARSVVRNAIGSGFPGGTYRQVFYVADVEASGPPLNGELHVDLDEADFLGIFPLAATGRVRLIGTVRDERADRADTLRFEDVSSRAINSLKLQVSKVNWFSTYHVHHRVTNHFRRGRAFLLGDAAHIHSPAGGQGMNTGIGDAINLAWKLATVVAGRAPDALLDTYEAERIGFARSLVATTDRAFSLVTADGGFANFVRTRIAPLLIPHLTAFKSVREFMFRSVSQIRINYRGKPLSAGAAGLVQGGDRLPWVAVDGRDNYASLVSIDWQIHVYGAARPELVKWCGVHDVPLHTFDWRSQYANAGLAANALYLLRPDTYVALADPKGSPESVDRFLADRGIRVGSR